jgi:exonuclease SbcC
MEIKLNQLKIENFKGLKSLNVEFSPDMTTIKGANGTGKTTIYDAFLWLLFGKDSSGRKDFELRPLDKNNEPLKGLVLTVEAEIFIDGSNRVLRKEHHEKIIKDQIRGYETLCWIDEVPKKVNEYEAFVSEIIAEDTFKLLTDLYFFNEKFHWSQRRAILLEIAGEIDKPDGFDELVAKLNSRSIEEYKSVLAEQKKRLIKERDDINPRIDELQRACESYISSDTIQLEKVREQLLTNAKALGSKRNKLIGEESERQKKIEAVNSLKSRRNEREGQLRNDVSGIKYLIEEKTKIESKLADVRGVIVEMQNKVSLAQSEIRTAQQVLNGNLQSLEMVRTDYAKINETKDSLICYACGQTLPQIMIDELEKKKQARLSEITKNGNVYKQAVMDCKSKIAAIEANIKEANRHIENEKGKLQKGEAYKIQRFTEIDSLIKSNQTIPFDQDDLWQHLTTEIAKVEKEIGEPVSEQLQKIETERDAIIADIEKCNAALASADRNKKDEARIVELEAREKELGQSIADIDKQLSSIDEYMITDAVNKIFKHVEFKLFNQLLNGGYEDCCEAMINGVPYADMSCGQKIIVGIDIINVLSGHYKLSVPLFIDNAESLTYPLEADMQTIKLYAQEDIKSLKIENGIKPAIKSVKKSGKKEVLFK